MTIWKSMFLNKFTVLHLEPALYQTLRKITTKFSTCPTTYPTPALVQLKQSVSTISSIMHALMWCHFYLATQIILHILFKSTLLQVTLDLHINVCMHMCISYFIILIGEMLQVCSCVTLHGLQSVVEHGDDLWQLWLTPATGARTFP